jgi:hypothetical protein
MSANRFEGDIYATEGRLDVVEIAKRMRTFIKSARKLGVAGGGIDLPAEARVSVKVDRYSMGQAVRVVITAPVAWVYVAPGAPCNFIGDANCPTFGGHTLAAQVAVRIIRAELDRYNRDNSDSMSDYYDTWFHADVVVEPAERVRENPAMTPVRGVWAPDVDAAVTATPYMVEAATRRAAAIVDAVEVAPAAPAPVQPMDVVDVVDGAVESLGAPYVSDLLACLLAPEMEAAGPAPIRRRGHLSLVHSA